MSEFKIGDKVLVEAKIVGEDRQTNKYRLKPIANSWTFWAVEDKIHRLIVKGENASTKTYEDGLNEAWELARSVLDMGVSDLRKIFGVGLDVSKNHGLLTCRSC